jgi:N-acetylglucosamine-6-sulfatase
MVRKSCKYSVVFALLSLVASLGMTASQTDMSHAQMTVKPNIVFILTDDMRASDLDKVVNGQYVMPKTRNLLVTQGVKFTKPWVTRSLCCPSRATVLRGQYTHNHRVWVNVNPSGGFWNFYDRGLESSTIATWLDRRDGVEYYDTILIGKYLNRYGLARNGTYQPTTHVPQGWDKWYAWEGTYDSPNIYDINQNGRIVTHQRSQIHDTDLYANKAVKGRKLHKEHGWRSPVLHVPSTQRSAQTRLLCPAPCEPVYRHAAAKAYILQRGRRL